MALFDNIFIVSDIDGTFFDDTGVPAVRNLEAVEYFKKNGGLFTFVTGRNLLNVIEVMPNIGSIANVPLIFCNGAGLYDVSNKKIVERHLIKDKDIVELASYLRNKYKTIGLRAAAEDFVITDMLSNSYIQKDYAKFGGIGRLINTFESWLGFEYYKLVVRDDAEFLKEVKKDIDSSRFGELVDCCLSGKDILDIQAKGRNKGVMLETLAEKYGETRVVYGVGDCFNDLEMLNVADVSVCPKSAEDEVKKCCDLVLCDNNKGIIYDLVEYIKKDIDNF